MVTFRRGGLDIYYALDTNRNDPITNEVDPDSNKLQVMRLDLAVWTRKRLELYNPKNTSTSKDTNLATSDAYESHWLRFEKYMGEKQLGGLASTTEGRFILTDVDFLRQGNTFYKHPGPFLFRNV